MINKISLILFFLIKIKYCYSSNDCDHVKDEPLNPEVCLAENTATSCSQPVKDENKNYKWESYKKKIEAAVMKYKPCPQGKCSCHYPLIKEDLASFPGGITVENIEDARPRGVLYQVIDKKLFRQKDCMFPSRCSGIEHFILKVIKELPNMEFVVNVKDYPQSSKSFNKIPIFSFSKTQDYWDITYPAWTFWEGGPAIKIYPTGIGRFDQFRKRLMAEADLVPWSKKEPIAFFRGSRTNAERDALIYLSRSSPELADCKYTKNQAWKSDADTLHMPPAVEVTMEHHCAYKYLFNYRGVAASFRLKHLFLCGSLVFHSGQGWIEFFYPQLKPWVHYIPVPNAASQDDIKDLILFAKANDALVKAISDRGFEFIRDHLRIKDVLCYWRKLLISYSSLLQYEVEKRDDTFQIKN